MRREAWSLPIRMMLIILSLALMGAQGCNGDDDDDSIDDDGSPADDDNDTLTPDDDDSSTADDDNDTSSDDDNDDDTDADDDVDDDDVTPSDEDRLVLVGTTADGYAAWTQTADGWEMQAIPAPEVPEKEMLILGPVLIHDGETGYSLWNRFHPIENVVGLGYTTGNQWLTYDRQNGWRENDEIAPALPRRFVRWIGLPAGDSLWVSSQWFLSIFYFVGSIINENLLLMHYDGASPGEDYDLGENRILAIDIPTATTGLLQVWPEPTQVFAYDGVTWRPFDPPAGFETGRFHAFSLDESLNGYAIYYDNSTIWVVEIQDDVWTKVPMPTECLEPERFEPWSLVRNGDHVVVLEGYRDQRFMEKRDGQWYCRKYETEEFAMVIRHALAYTDDIVYLAVDQQYDLGRRVLRFDPDGYEDLTLPPKLEHLRGLYMTGPTAPPRQYITGEMYILY
ncbi:MAG TPA: hypothetical protein PKW95_09455 [bacterium]|nr:hypothetical protein [bacterium]